MRKSLTFSMSTGRLREVIVVRAYMPGTCCLGHPQTNAPVKSCDVGLTFCVAFATTLHCHYNTLFVRYGPIQLRYNDAIENCSVSLFIVAHAFVHGIAEHRRFICIPVIPSPNLASSGFCKSLNINCEKELIARKILTLSLPCPRRRK